MNTKKSFIVLDKLRKKLGNDLVYAVAYDDGEYYVSISTHKSSDRIFDHGGHQRTCKIEQSEFNKPVEDLIDEIVKIMKGIIIKKDDLLTHDSVESQD